MRIAATILSVWTALRWLGFSLGLIRLRWFEDLPHREARRAVINCGAINVFLSVSALFLWAEALQLRLSASFVGFLAAAMMCSLAIGVAALFMQPEERTRETIGICRFTWPGGPRHVKS